jgi:hypothetical protein
VAQTGSLSLFTTLATRLDTLRLTACIARLNGLGVEVESPGKEIEEQEHDGVSFSGYAFMLRADSLLPVDLSQFSPVPDRGRTPHARIAAKAPPTVDSGHLWEGL